jgi:hypothetical protein
MVDRFTLACLALDGMAVDQVSVVSGDEVGAELIAAEDLTPDLDTFAVALASGSSADDRTALLTSYVLHRASRAITWRRQRTLTVSLTNGGSGHASELQG